MRDLPLAPTVTSLSVRPWPDAVIDELGFDPRSRYVERYWLGVLGPTATWLLRRLASRLEEEPEGFELDVPATAAELGVPGGAGASKTTPFLRSLQRCAHFGALDVGHDGTIRVRRKLPPLTRYQLARLPLHLQEEHEEGAARDGGRGTVEEIRERARGYALSLVAQGQGAEEAERALHAEGVHPAMAHAAVTWALAHPMVASATGDPLPPAA